MGMLGRLGLDIMKMCETYFCSWFLIHGLMLFCIRVDLMRGLFSKRVIHGSVEVSKDITHAVPVQPVLRRTFGTGRLSELVFLSKAERSFIGQAAFRKRRPALLMHWGPMFILS